MHCWRSSMVEPWFCKPVVVGSSPIASSIAHSSRAMRSAFSFCYHIPSLRNKSYILYTFFRIDEYNAQCTVFTWLIQIYAFVNCNSCLQFLHVQALLCCMTLWLPNGRTRFMFRDLLAHIHTNPSGGGLDF